MYAISLLSVESSLFWTIKANCEPIWDFFSQNLEEKLDLSSLLYLAVEFPDLHIS